MPSWAAGVLLRKGLCCELPFDEDAISGSPVLIHDPVKERRIVIPVDHHQKGLLPQYSCESLFCKLSVSGVTVRTGYAQLKTDQYIVGCAGIGYDIDFASRNDPFPKTYVDSSHFLLLLGKSSLSIYVRAQ